MHTTLPPPYTHHSPVVSSRPQHDCHGINGVPQLGVERQTELPASQEAMSKLATASDATQTTETFISAVLGAATVNYPSERPTPSGESAVRTTSTSNVADTEKQRLGACGGIRKCREACANSAARSAHPIGQKHELQHVSNCSLCGMFKRGTC